MSNYTSIFASRATSAHSDKYDYSLLPNTFTYNTWVPIICHSHGVFQQKARTHAEGSGCPQCAHEIRHATIYARRRHTKEQFIAKACAVHGNYYDYSETLYVGQMKRLYIRCPKHGIFDIIANNHVHGTGCAACKRSRGETLIENWLRTHNIQYEPQKSFSDLSLPDVVKVTNRPRYDFYLPLHNMVIEYDGKQHFEPVNFHGVSDAEALRLHMRTVMSDGIKDAYASKIGFVILRISYKQISQIEAILTNHII